MKASATIGILFSVLLLTSAPFAAPGLSAAGGPVYLPLLTTNRTTGVWLEMGAGSASGGGISDNSSRSEVPSVAIAPDGTVYVAWNDRGSQPDQIYVRRWDGFVWQEVGEGSAFGGGISNTSGASKWTSMAVAPDGAPWVAWEEWSSGIPAIYVRYWDGAAWQEAGAGSASGDGISNGVYSRGPSVAVAPDGTVYVAWSEEGGAGWEVYILRWDGSSWEEVGLGSASSDGISNSGGNSAGVSLAIAPDGVVYAVWEYYAAKNQVYIRSWDGSAWREVGAGSASGTGISNNASDSYQPSLSIASDGTPYVAWSDDSGGGADIYVRSWDGSAWQEVGTGSASGGGISRNGGDSASPSVAVTPGGAPYVAWSDDSGGNAEIYLRTWDGSTWQEAGSGSAGGGGISQSSDYSWRPSLAISPTGTPYVAWYDRSGGNFEIYARRYMR